MLEAICCLSTKFSTPPNNSAIKGGTCLKTINCVTAWFPRCVCLAYKHVCSKQLYAFEPSWIRILHTPVY